jgi:hypothetical protein
VGTSCNDQTTDSTPDVGADFDDASAAVADATLGAPDLEGGGDSVGDGTIDNTTTGPPSGDDESDTVEAASVLDGDTLSPDFAWYLLNETGGTTAKDSTSNHYDVPGLSGVTWNAGAYFVPDGGCGWVSVDSSFRSAPLTLSGWLLPLTRSDEATTSHGEDPYPTNAFGDDDLSDYGYGIGLNVWSNGDGGAALAVEGIGTCQPGGPGTCLVSETPADGGAMFLSGHEYFVAEVITEGSSADSGTNMASVYVNGTLLDFDRSQPLTLGATKFWLGCHDGDLLYGTKRIFSGRMRDIRVYKRSLEAEEIARLYTLGPATSATP